MTAKNKSEVRTASQVKAMDEEAKIKKALRKRDEKVLLRRVSHIGIVVKDVYEALSAFDTLFEFVRDVHVETLPEQGVKVAIVPLEGADIEFIQPVQPGTGVARFLEHRGEGLHHIALQVEDIEETLKSVGSKGAQLIDKEPWRGVRGSTAFVHPSSLRGVLVELDQSPPKSDV
jgi:methylmalonyl-CoA epimerase